MSRDLKQSYKKEYEKFGIERRQDVCEDDERFGLSREASQEEKEKYWKVRRDAAWAEIPTYLVPGGKRQVAGGAWKKIWQTRAQVAEILNELAPDKLFDPYAVWQEEKLAEEGQQLLLEGLPHLVDGGKGSNSIASKAADAAKAFSTSETDKTLLEAATGAQHALTAAAQVMGGPCSEDVWEKVAAAIDLSGNLLNLAAEKAAALTRDPKGGKDAKETVKKLKEKADRLSKNLEELRKKFLAERRIVKETAVFELLGQYVICIFQDSSKSSNPIKPIKSSRVAHALMKIMFKKSDGMFVGSEELKGSDKTRLENICDKAKREIVDEIVRIRTLKQSNNLLSLSLNDLRTKQARLVYLMEMLKRSVDANNKKETFEILWAVEGLDPLEFNAPASPNLPDLIYDSYNDVVKLINQAKDIRRLESDMIKFQLTEMSDALPPLSKFSFGYKLDEWQKRTLRWIEAGKSAIICAPTSSGKTVLSSFVALLPYHMKKAAGGDGPAPSEGSGSSSRAAGGSRGGGGGGGGGKDDDEPVFGNDDIVVEEDEDAGRPMDFEEEAPEEEAKMLVNAQVAREDTLRRQEFRKTCSDGAPRILFVVPAEPLVWQVAAYFSKLLRSNGDVETKVSIVTDQMMYNPSLYFGVMPQIIVGTPLALESALTKPRGLVGVQEYYYKKAGDSLPGGFDHFRWVIYDEVHSLDGPEGDALQRIIRSMNCNFLALSATVGNAEELRRWMERVKGDQLFGVECVDATSEEVPRLPPAPPVDLPGPFVTVAVTRTMDGQTIVLDGISESKTTVAMLKEKIASVWTKFPPAEQQLIISDTRRDMDSDSAALASYGLFSTTATSEGHYKVELRQLVNMISHEVRFINLQRYVWRGVHEQTLEEEEAAIQAGGKPAPVLEAEDKLIPINPLAAIESVASLQSGDLNNSSLSMTPIDSYRLWEEMERLFPRSAISAMDPHVYFGSGERITLQKTKLYQDDLKRSLGQLARDFPSETKELLYRFRLEDSPSHDFNICELVLELKRRDMIPCLGFHLDSFEAIKLFQQLLAGLEYRQYCAHPNFYEDKEKEMLMRKEANEKVKRDCGGNAQALEMAIKAGLYDPNPKNFEVDWNEPHPDYRITRKVVMTYDEFMKVSDEMERRDGFEARDRALMRSQFGQNDEVLKHALMRGLRRGIGIYISGVSFPTYRRAVQKLASEGKLGVVISDDSLAFGVNMPFRTCVFCGEMGGLLTPLMAQQMSGRAGRRGLDTQGNIVYAGSRPSFIRNLMIGAISPITGEGKLPKYDSMFLQGMVSPRHVGWGRVQTLGGKSLEEFRKKLSLPDKSYSLDMSRQAMIDLRFIKEDEDGSMQPMQNIPYLVLSMIWELRQQPYIGVTVGRLAHNLFKDIEPFYHDNSKMNSFYFTFLGVILMLVDRQPCAPDAVPLHKNSIYEEYPENKRVIAKWAKLFKDVYYSIPPHLHHLRDPVAPPPQDSDEVHTPLDGTLLQCLIDPNRIFQFKDEEKQVLKERIWKVGNVVRHMYNNMWPHTPYYLTTANLLWKTFKHFLRLMTDLVRDRIDFENISSSAAHMSTSAAAKEWNTSIKTAAKVFAKWREKHPSIEVAEFHRVVKKIQLQYHSLSGGVDLSFEPCLKFPNPWHVSFNQAASRSIEWLALHSTVSPISQELDDTIMRLQRGFATLRDADRPLIRLAVVMGNPSLTLANVCTPPPSDDASNGKEEESIAAGNAAAKEVDALRALPWAAAFDKAISILEAFKTSSTPPPAAQAISNVSEALCSVFNSLSAADKNLITVGAAMAHGEIKSVPVASVVSAVINSSLNTINTPSERGIIAALIYLASKNKSGASYFPLYLKTLYDNDKISEDTIKDWHASKGGESAEPVIPGATLPADLLSTLRAKSADFVKWLDEAGEEDDDDDDEEEEDD